MVVIDTTSSENTINYPDHVSEFEVHSELYMQLKQYTNADIRAEVKSRGTHGLRKEKTACRFDLVAFVENKAICIIEVKDKEVRHKTSIHDTRQGIRYPTYGIPVIVCYGLCDIQLVVDKVNELLGHS